MATPAPPGHHHRLMPVLVAALAIALYSVMDALMKAASLVSGVYPALFLRSVIGAAMLVPVWRWRGGHWPARAALRLHMARGVIGAGMAGTFFYGIVRMPMAEGVALSFIAPLIAIFLAAATLGERVRREAIHAAIFGLAGTIVIALGQLSGAAYGPEAMLGISAIMVSAVLYAVNLVLQRKQAQMSGPVEVALFQHGVIALVLGVLAIALLPLGGALADRLIPPQEALGLVAGAAGATSVSLMLLAWAYARAEAQVLVSLEYTAFLWLALIGWLWFGEVVTITTLAGLALILAGVWLGTRARAIPGGAAALSAPPA